MASFGRIFKFVRVWGVDIVDIIIGVKVIDSQGSREELWSRCCLFTWDFRHRHYYNAYGVNNSIMALHNSNDAPCFSKLRWGVTCPFRADSVVFI